MSNIVAIVGRPNVGKSTLFNRLIKNREAIVDAVSGVTRDRHYGKSDWNGKYFSLIDTGGYIVGSEDNFEAEIRQQVSLAIDQCDVIFFVVSVEEGVLSTDITVAEMLRKQKKPVILVVNKVDNNNRLLDATEFYNLGFDTYYTISATNGSGTGDLLDHLCTYLKNDTAIEASALPKFAIVGRPNAGKSSFINTLTGTDRNIVTSISGTTRDAIHTTYKGFGLTFDLIDTAGIRKKSKVSENLEFYSVMRAVRAIEHCDVALLMVDATRGFEAQDMSIFSLIERNKKGLVIVINKWDLIEKNHQTMDFFIHTIKEKIAPFDDVPIVFTSTITKQRMLKAMQTALKVYENRQQKIVTRKLNETMLPVIEHYPPPSVKGKYIKIKFCTQLPTHTPQFVFFANLPQYVKEPYKRYLENNLRKHYDFEGVPIVVYIRKK